MLVWLCLGGAAQALELALLAGATETARSAQPDSSVALATGADAAGAAVFQSFDGRLLRVAWRLDQNSSSTGQLMAALRQDLAAQGYRPTFECQTEACGGFDFRFALDLFAEPLMHVDLGDFRYIFAEGPAQEPDTRLALMVSRSAAAGHVQLILTAPAATGPAPADAPAAGLPDTGPGPLAVPGTGADAATVLAPLARLLDETGRAVLEDLAFPSGSSELGTGDFQSLRTLADYLVAHPEVTVALVGHTDTIGTLDANMALSRRRAQSVAGRLVTEFAIARERIDAAGIGYLAPRASNATPEGRDKNRRVEVVVTSTR